MKLPTIRQFAVAAALFAGAAGISTAQAQSAFFSYSQNFDLALTNSGTTLPAGFTSMVIAGANSDYVAANPISSTAIAEATADTQALVIWNAGSAVTKNGAVSFNIGCWDSLNDRALGTDPTGTGAQVIQLSLTNTTGYTLTGVTFSYDCKCLTNGSVGTEESELPGYCFFYSTTGTSAAANWTEVGVAGTAALSNGVPVANGLCLPNFTQGTTMSSGPVNITFATPLTNGGTVFFRWADDNNEANSPDQMLAIDNINISTGPAVSIISPTNGTAMPPDSALTIIANATDSVITNTITAVTFYIDGSPEFTVNSPASGSSYVLPVPAEDITAGTYVLTAVATDSAGLTATSSVVNVIVAYAPPTVSLTSPTNSSSYPSGSSIAISASAISSDAAASDVTVTNVAFYQGSTLLGNSASPFAYTWQNVPAGSYALTAVATDSKNLSTTSSVVSISVTNDFGVPVVSLTSPANNTAFTTGSSVSLAANASEAGGTITNVEFYAGTTALGGSTVSPYSLNWPGVSAGNYALTAVASDANGLTTTSSVINITVAAAVVPPAVSLTSPANRAALNVASGLTLSATATPNEGTITNVAFYQNTFLISNVTSAPYSLNWTNAPSGNYTLTAVATDSSGISSTSSVVNIIATNAVQIQTLQQIKTLFIIPLENHDLVQADPTGSPEQVQGNPAAPYFNSLITPGNSNAIQTAWATHYFSAAINGEHPSEPNYIWSEAGTDFGVRTDDDPSNANGNVYTNVQHLSGQLTAAGIPWRSYQEDLEYSSSELVSASGGNGAVNPYNGTTEYYYAVKHNPMAFFTDTQFQNVYPMTNFWNDLTNNNIGRYNWITPDQYNEMHSGLPSGYTYHGVAYTGDQAAIAEGDNALSIIIPKIMASAAYKDHGAIIIWTDETESTDDTNTTLPYVIISSLAKGNAYASTLPYSHSSDLKTMDELFGLAYQTNTIPAGYLDAQNTGTNYVDGRSATIYDMSDFFKPVAVNISGAIAQPASGFQLTFTGPASQTYEVMASTNLTSPSGWVQVGSGTFGSTNAVFTDSNSANYSGRFYTIKSP